MKKARWGMDYDFRTDKTFMRPVCPTYNAGAIIKDGDGYVCVCCGNPIEVSDQKMREWIEARQGEKIEYQDCFLCGGKGTDEIHMRKNEVTLEWESAYGKCNKCGGEWIV